MDRGFYSSLVGRYGLVEWILIISDWWKGCSYLALWSEGELYFVFPLGRRRDGC